MDADAELRIDATLDGGEASCALLTPLIRGRMREMESGQVLEVVTAEPTAETDIAAWSRLTGNPLLQVVERDGARHFYLRKK